MPLWRPCGRLRAIGGRGGRCRPGGRIGVYKPRQALDSPSRNLGEVADGVTDDIHHDLTVDVKPKCGDSRGGFGTQSVISFGPVRQLVTIGVSTRRTARHHFLGAHLTHANQVHDRAVASPSERGAQTVMLGFLARAFLHIEGADTIGHAPVRRRGSHSDTPPQRLAIFVTVNRRLAHERG